MFGRLEWLDSFYLQWKDGRIDVMDFPNWYQELVMIMQREINAIITERTMKAGG